MEEFLQEEVFLDDQWDGIGVITIVSKIDSCIFKVSSGIWHFLFTKLNLDLRRLSIGRTPYNGCLRSNSCLDFSATRWDGFSAWWKMGRYQWGCRKHLFVSILHNLFRWGQCRLYLSVYCPTTLDKHILLSSKTSPEQLYASHEGLYQRSTRSVPVANTGQQYHFGYC